MKQRKRGWIKWVICGLLLPIVLSGVLVALIYFHPFQRFAVNRLIPLLLTSSDYRITAEDVRLTYPLHLTMRGVVVTDTPSDTLLNVEELKVNVALAPLRHKRVWVTSFLIKEAIFHSGEQIDGMQLEAYVKRLKSNDVTVELQREEVQLRYLELSGAKITLALDSLSPSKSSEDTVRWRIFWDQARLQHVAFELANRPDSMDLSTYFEEAVLEGGAVDIAQERVDLPYISIFMGEFSYNNLCQPHQKRGVDPSHLRFTQINMKADSLFYQTSQMGGILRSFAMDERSGFSITDIRGRVAIDSVWCLLPNLQLRTPYSKIDLQGRYPWSLMDPSSQAKMQARFTAFINKKDLFLVMGESADEFEAAYPDSMLTFSGRVDGNWERLYVRRLQGALPGIFSLDAAGAVQKMTDKRNRSGTVDLTAHIEGRSLFKRMLPGALRGRLDLPDTLRLTMDGALKHGAYQGRLRMSEKQGRLDATVQYDLFREMYDMELRLDEMNLMHYLPKDSFGLLTASLHAKGRGLDLFADSTHAELFGEITQFSYKQRDFTDITLDGTLKHHLLKTTLTSDYPEVRGSVTLDGSVGKEQVAGMLIVDVDSLDLQGLGVIERPMSHSFQLFSEFQSDMKRDHWVDVSLGNWEMTLEDHKVEPKMLTLHARSQEDTTRVSFHVGDLGLVLTGNADVQALTDQLIRLTDEVIAQNREDSLINLPLLRPLFPEIQLQLRASQDNPLYNFLQEKHLFFNEFTLDLGISPMKGVEMDAYLNNFLLDTFKVDTIHMQIWQDTLGVKYEVQAKKYRFLRQEPFSARLHGEMTPSSADLAFTYLDGAGKVGFDLGTQLSRRAGGYYDFHFYPAEPVLAFHDFQLNSDHFFSFKNLKEITANIKLTGEDQSSIWLYSDSVDQHPEVGLELNHLNLESITSHISLLPSMKGILNTTFRYMPSENSFLMLSDANIDDWVYEDLRFGEVMINATYVPLTERSHQVDMHLFKDQREISSVSLRYQEGKREKRLEGVVSIDRFPLEMMNPMITNRMVGLQGELDAAFTVGGTSENPLINGQLQTKDGVIKIIPASASLRMDNQPLKMVDNQLLINDYKFFSLGKNPFVLTGKLDATSFQRPLARFELKGNNVQLMQSQKNPESLIYGTLFINMNTLLQGPLTSLKMRGDLRVLGNTNMSYVMKEDPLEMRDGFADLVTFTSFLDTIPRVRPSIFSLFSTKEEILTLGGMDVLLNINIDPTVRLKIDFSEDLTNRVTLRGGGTLSYHYSPQGDMLLTGRYNISEGLMRYTIPVIPLRSFTIKEGSYVEWTGEMMNPQLHITAFDRVRSSVRFDGQSRMVDFEAGIRVRDQLSKMSLQFLLEAPSDISVQNQLIVMGEEERAKQAIGLLVTGAYLAGGGGGMQRVDVGSALGSILQKELNHMLGNMVGDMPISFNVNTYSGMDGTGRRIDYLGRFYKEFFNSRFNTTLGMRYSTGDPVVGNKLFLDDITLEYRLNVEGSRAMKLFRKKEYESLFEGDITKTGAAFLFRHRLKRIGDLFCLPKRQTKKEEGDR